MVRPLLSPSPLLHSAGQPNSWLPRPQHQSDKQAFTSATTAILVDVVVRDHRGGAPVTDLTSDDFAVFEDGVAQKIDSFSRVTRGGGIGVGIGGKRPRHARVAGASGAEPAEVSAADRAQDEGATALVFDHLSEDALQLAQRAMLKYVPMNGDSDIRVGRVRDRASRVAAPAVHNQPRRDQEGSRRPGACRHGGGRSKGRAAAGRGRSPARAAGEHAGTRGCGGNRRRWGAGAGWPRNGPDRSGTAASRTRALMIDSFEVARSRPPGLRHRIDRWCRSFDSLAEMPGRKSIVFFSEGLPVSPALSARLDHLIEAANRANVTVYAVDAKGSGPRARPPTPARRCRRSSTSGCMQIGSGPIGTEQPMTMAFERVEDTVRLDSRTGPGAAGRGHRRVPRRGVEQSGAAFKRIDEDNQFHYLLTYSPRNPSSTASSARSRSRSIGPARRCSRGRDIGPFGRRGRSTPADYESCRRSRCSHRTPLPNAFPVHAAGFNFPDPARPGLTPVVVHVGTIRSSFNVDQQQSTYSAQDAIVVRIRDEKAAKSRRSVSSTCWRARPRTWRRQSRARFFSTGSGSARARRLHDGDDRLRCASRSEGSARVATLTVRCGSSCLDGMSSLILVNRVEEKDELRPAARPRFTSATTAVSESRRADSEVLERRTAVLLHAVRRRAAARTARLSCCGTGSRSPKRQSSGRRKPVRGCSRSAGCRSARCQAEPTSCASASVPRARKSRAPRSSRCRSDGCVQGNSMQPKRLLISSLAALIVGTILSVAVGGQEPRFTTETSLVEVDVVVRDSNRQPVRGLTTADSQYSRMTFVSQLCPSPRSTWGF